MGQGTFLVSDSAIVCFAHTRPDHLLRMLNSLMSNEVSSLLPIHAYIDGHRSEIEKAKADECETVLNRFQRVLQIKIIRRSSNYGLSSQVLSGVSEVLESFESVIVLEDDLELSPHFLDFMLQGLEIYRDNPKVASIHGYIYPHSKRNLPDSFFVRGADCWGWATWRDRWESATFDAEYLSQEISRRRLVSKLNYGRGKSHSDLLSATLTGSVDSWAIRWHASAILKDQLTLYPRESLVANTGNDGSGTNSRISQSFDQEVSRSPVTVERIPVKESPQGLLVVQQHFSRKHKTLGRAFLHEKMRLTRKLAKQIGSSFRKR